MKKVLTIAGSDCSGGAGIQADIKTITAHKMYAMSVVTALTAQNTTGVYGIQAATPELVARQLDCVFSDIRPEAVKIGMVSNAAIIEVIADKLQQYQACNIILDPVMVSTSGSRLLDPHAAEVLRNRLMPLADLVTPNLPEAELLCGFSVVNQEDMLKAAREIAQGTGRAVLVKGGHCSGAANDLFYDDGGPVWFEGERIHNSNTHGTGCTLSSAIACNLAAGCSMAYSILNAKAYITGALRDGLDLGKGKGPLNHCYCI